MNIITHYQMTIKGINAHIDQLQWMLEGDKDINILYSVKNYIVCNDFKDLIKYSEYNELSINNLLNLIEVTINKINKTNIKNIIGGLKVIKMDITDYLKYMLELEKTVKTEIEKTEVVKTEVEKTEVEKTEVEKTELLDSIFKVEKTELLDSIFKVEKTEVEKTEIVKLSKKQKTINKLKSMINEYIDNGGIKEPFKGVEVEKLSVKALNQAIKDLYQLNNNTINIKFNF